METLWDKLFGPRPPYLAVCYQGHDQDKAEKEGIQFQSEIQQYGLRCHIHQLNQPIPMDTDFVYCTYFTPLPAGQEADCHYFRLCYKNNKSYPDSIKAFVDNPPPLYAAHMDNLSSLTESLIWIWANKKLET